jgi:hypothetical protein
VALAVIDEIGYFVLRSISPGSYDMVLSADRVEVWLLPVDVGL